MTKISDDEFKARNRFYRKLLGLALDKGWRPTAAGVIYKKRYKEWPPAEWSNASPLEPDSEAMDWASKPGPIASEDDSFLKRNYLMLKYHSLERNWAPQALEIWFSSIYRLFPNPAWEDLPGIKPNDDFIERVIKIRREKEKGKV